MPNQNVPNDLNFEKEPVVELEPDDPPKNGVWVESGPPTDEEAEEGLRLGEELGDDAEGENNE